MTKIKKPPEKNDRRIMSVLYHCFDPLSQSTMDQGRNSIENQMYVSIRCSSKDTAQLDYTIKERDGYTDFHPAASSNIYFNIGGVDLMDRPACVFDLQYAFIRDSERSAFNGSIDGSCPDLLPDTDGIAFP